MTGINAGQLERLLELQRRDTRLDEQKARLAELEYAKPLRQVLAEIKRLEAALAETEQRLNGAELTARGAELEAAGHRSERERLEQRLYGGGIVSVKEVEKLEAQMAFLAEQADAAEMSALEAMEAAESFTARARDLSARIDELKSRASELRAERAAGLEEVGALVAEAEARRDEAAEGISQQLLSRYARLRERIKGAAVVAVRGAACGGCDVSLPLALINNVKKMDGLYTCENCGRALVWAGG